MFPYRQDYPYIHINLLKHEFKLSSTTRTPHFLVEGGRILKLNSMRLQPREPWSQEDINAFDEGLKNNVNGLFDVRWEEPPTELEEIFA